MKIATLTLFLLPFFINPLHASSDSERIVIRGKIINKDSKNTIPYVNLRTSSGEGTISNHDGVFSIKLSSSNISDTLYISRLGFESKKIALRSITGEELLIELMKNPIMLDDIMVYDLMPEEILLKALSTVKNNYPTLPEQLTAFYREKTQKGNRYISVAEAIIYTYKAPYGTQENDRPTIHKARKESYLKKIDSLAVKLQGGIASTFFLDVAKNPYLLLEENLASTYNFRFGEVTKFGNRRCYKIIFRPNFPQEFVYEGVFYIDIESFAFQGIEFNIPATAMEKALNKLFVKKPANIQVELIDVSYRVGYILVNNTWRLSHTKGNLIFSAKKRGSLFKKNYATTFEMVVTNYETTTKKSRPAISTVTKTKDVLIESVADFADPDFWGEYHIIYPEEDIEKAIERLGRKINRNK